MVKKVSMHPKAIEANQRKQDKKAAEMERQRKEAEESYWKDDDKIANRKQARKNQKEEKRLEAILKKEEKKQLLENEMKLLSGKDDGTPQKVTRKEIAGHIEKLGPVGSTLGVTISSPAKKVKNKPTATDPNVPTDDEEILMKDIPLNLNRLNNDAIHATGVDQAIDVLGQLNLGGKDDNGDRNPERRQRAAYNAYRDREMDRLKTEQPTLNYSQKQQIIFKNWQKSPENPVYRQRIERS